MLTDLKRVVQQLRDLVKDGFKKIKKFVITIQALGCSHNAALTKKC
jgi:hypothetical protein